MFQKLSSIRTGHAVLSRLTVALALIAATAAFFAPPPSAHAQTLDAVLSSSTVNENSSTTLTMSINCGTTTSARLTVTATMSGGTAESGDFAFQGGGTSKTTLPIGCRSGDPKSEAFVIIANQDTDTDDETINISFTSTSLTAPSTLTLTADDDDTLPTVTLALSSNPVTEGSSTNVTASLSAAHTQAVTVTVAAAAGTAESGDFSLSTNTTLTIAQGSTSSTGTVTITANQETGANADTDDETVTVSGTVSGGPAAPTSLTLTINDDDLPTVTLALSPNPVTEGGSTTVTASLSAAHSSAVSITVGAAAGTAESGDFTLSTNTTLTIVQGSTSSTGTVTITANQETGANADTDDETVTVSGSVTAGGLTNPSSLTLTINDDDTPLPTVTLALSSNPVTEGGSTTVTASLSAAYTSAVTITVAAAAGTAESGDFTLSTNTTLTIAQGSTSSTGTVTIATSQDTDSDNETVTVSGTVQGQGTRPANPASLTLTINDDEKQKVGLSVSANPIAEGGIATLTLSVDCSATNKPTSAVTVTVSAAPVSPTVAADYEFVGNIIQAVLGCGSGESATDSLVRIHSFQDDDADDETINVSFSVSGTQVNAPDRFTLTVTDDDAAVTVILTPGTVSEGGSAAVTASLSKAAAAATTVTVSAAAGTAEANDFTLSANKTLTIAQGSTTSTGTVTITANQDADSDHETVTVTAKGSGGTKDSDTATLTISDDEAVVPAADEGGGGTGGNTGGDTGGGNSAPVVANKISDRTVSVGSTVDVPLSGSFRDPDGDRLSYAAVTSDASKASVSVSGDRLKLVGVAEGNADITVTASDGRGGSVSDTFKTTVTRQAAARVVLPELARAMAGQTVSTIGRRIEQAITGGVEESFPTGIRPVTPPGRRQMLTGDNLTEENALAMDQLLANSDFSLPVGGPEASGGRLALWGSGDYSNFSDGSGALNWDGDVLNLHLGADARLHPNLITGVAMSWGRGKADYTNSGVRGSNEVSALGVHPYLGLRMGRFTLWGTGGYSWGNFDIDESGLGSGKSDLTMLTVGGGLSGELANIGATRLRLRTEFMQARMEVDRIAGVTEDLKIDVNRLRASVEASHTFASAGGTRFWPMIEVGYRRDGGDGKTASGAEIGGGLHLDTPGGFTLEGRGRFLVDKDGINEWGVSGLILLGDPGSRGLSVSLAPGYGVFQRDVEAIWRSQWLDADSAYLDPQARVEGSVGYGFGVTEGLLTPYGSFTLGELESSQRMGMLWARDSAFRMRLEGERRELYGYDRPEHIIMLHASVPN